MRTVGAYKAKTHLSDLLDDVEQGEGVTITRYGQPVARLLPAQESNQTKTEETVSAIKQFRQDRKLGDVDLSSLIRDGRA